MTSPGAGKEGESSPFESSSGINSRNSDGVAQCTAATTASGHCLRQAFPQATDAGFDRL